jgi:hypothetical protein
MNFLRNPAANIAASLLLSGAALAQGFLVEDSASARHYGTATGQTAQPSSRVQAFGPAVHGRSVDLQLRDARPAAAAWFYLSFAPGYAELPGMGTVLVDLAAPTTVGAVTDAAGRASVQLPIPHGIPAGTTVYVQCLTVDIGAPEPQFELSSAAEIVVGEVARPICATANVDGNLQLQNGTNVSSMSGLYGTSYSPIGVGATAEGGLSLQVKAADFGLYGAAVSSFMVNSASDQAALVWDANNCFTATSFYTTFDVTYRIGADPYGPLQVTGTLTASPTGVTLDLSPLPVQGAGQLGGADLVLALQPHQLAPNFFDVKAGLLLPVDGSEGSLVTPQDADLAFATLSTAMSNAIAASNGDVTFYDAFMPAYPEFEALESEILRHYSDGRASNVQEVQDLIQANSISMQDGWLWTLASKILSAAGVLEGWDAFKEVLIENAGYKLEEIGKHIDAKEYSKAADKIGELLDIIFSDRFRSQFAQKAGNKMAGDILAKLGAKCVPFLGWLYFAACLLWTFVEQWL